MRGTVSAQQASRIDSQLSLSSDKIPESLLLQGWGLQSSQRTQAALRESSDRFLVLELQEVFLNLWCEVEEIQYLGYPCTADSVPFGELTSVVNQFSLKHSLELERKMNRMKRWLVLVLQVILLGRLSKEHQMA